MIAKTSTERLLPVLRQTGLVDGLPVSDVAAALSVIAYPRGAPIFHVGDTAVALFILIDGIVRVSFVNSGGDEKVISLFQAGDIFGELFLGKYRHRVGTAHAMTDVIVARLSEANFLSLAAHYPALAIGMIRHLADEQRETLARLHALMHLDARHRLLGTLLGLARKFCCTAQDSRWVTLPAVLTQEDIASAACVHRSTASLLINEYRRAGVLGGQRRSLSVNVEALQSLLDQAGLEILI